jgi:lantibiotic modifying enzyme
LTHLSDTGVPRAHAVACRAASVLAERVLDHAIGSSTRECGFAHGILGIYYALTRCSGSSVCKHVHHALQVLRPRVKELIGDGAFDKDPSWCRGMAGVLCCHREVELLGIQDAARIAGNIENLVENATDYSLCCGLAGLSSALAFVDEAISTNRRVRRSLIACRKACVESIGRNAGAPPALDQLGLMRGVVGSALSVTGTGRQVLARLLRLN